jgi:hypothetical protein
MASDVAVNIGGVSKKVSGIYVNIGGVTKTVSEGWINIGGVAKKFWPTVPPDPYYDANAYGVFTFDNYLDSSLLLLPPYISGGTRTPTYPGFWYYDYNNVDVPGEIELDSTTKKSGVSSLRFFPSRTVSARFLLKAPPESGSDGSVWNNAESQDWFDAISSQDFCMEGWFKQDGTDKSANRGLLSVTQAPFVTVVCEDGRYLYLNYKDSGGTDQSTYASKYDAGVDFMTSSFVHIAFSWESSSQKIRVFLNGTKVIELAYGSATIYTTANASQFSIGDYAISYYRFSGWVDHFRITLLSARYTANFTPPVPTT